MFHKEGHKIIVITLVVVVGLILLIDGFDLASWLKTTIMVTLLVFLLLILQDHFQACLFPSLLSAVISFLGLL